MNASKRAIRWEERRRRLAKEKLGIEIPDQSNWSRGDIWEWKRRILKLKQIGIVPIDLSNENIAELFKSHYGGY